LSGLSGLVGYCCAVRRRVFGGSSVVKYAEIRSEMQEKSTKNFFVQRKKKKKETERKGK
jgi:hypothetical protein